MVAVLDRLDLVRLSRERLPDSLCLPVRTLGLEVAGECRVDDVNLPVPRRFFESLAHASAGRDDLSAPPIYRTGCRQSRAPIACTCVPARGSGRRYADAALPPQLDHQRDRIAAAICYDTIVKIAVLPGSPLCA
jgi:hypothetical protein